MTAKSSKKEEDKEAIVAEPVSESHEKFAKLLNPNVLEVFKESYDKFTEVQVRAGIEILSHNDVIVESPTGSGKTLAFLLPTLTIMRKKPQWKPEEIGAVILSPSRELAVQIAAVVKPFTEKMGYLVHITIGGKKHKPADDLKEIKEKGCNVLVATPGRLEQLLSLDKDQKMRRMLKNVEVLIIDEADRFTESAFSTSVNDILSAIPKQRRTGLFSATQAKERGDLIKFQLRTPVSIKLKEQKDIVCPLSLKNYYTVCDAQLKMITLVEFIRNKADKKIIIFLASCQCVSYFHKIFSRILKKRPLFAVHGKKQQSRATQIDGFRKSDNGVMLCTDVMSRGIDIDDIDWVVQFDIPRNSSWFVHRAGRTARSGREGSSLLILTPKETAYTNFVQKYEQVNLEELTVKTVTELKADQLLAQMRKLATMDREILLGGTCAFVSFIEAYSKHDCHIVCQVKDLDIVGLAHSYGLHRLPKMEELSGRKDLDGFKRSDVDTSEIKFLDGAKEKTRKEKQEKKQTVKGVRKVAAAERKVKKEEKAERKRKAIENAAEAGKDGKPVEKKRKKDDKKKKGNDESDMNDFKLMQKLKGGRLTKKELQIVDF